MEWKDETKKNMLWFFCLVFFCWACAIALLLLVVVVVNQFSLSPRLARGNPLPGLGRAPAKPCEKVHDLLRGQPRRNHPGVHDTADPAAVGVKELLHECALRFVERRALATTV
jgi:hypothetical protein